MVLLDLKAPGNIVCDTHFLALLHKCYAQNQDYQKQKFLNCVQLRSETANCNVADYLYAAVQTL